MGGITRVLNNFIKWYRRVTCFKPAKATAITDSSRDRHADPEGK